MAYRILSAATLLVALATPALAQDDPEARAVFVRWQVEKTNPECLKPLGALTALEVSECKARVAEARELYRLAMSLRNSR